MLDQTANNVQVSQQTRFDRTGTPYQVKVYRYYLADQGPFSYETQVGPNNQTEFEQAVAVQAQELRGLGVLSY